MIFNKGHRRESMRKKTNAKAAPKRKKASPLSSKLKTSPRSPARKKGPKKIKVRAPPRKSKPSRSLAGYRYLEHTGDIMVEAWGPDYLSALKQAAAGMFAVFGPARPKEYFEIDEQALGKEELVVYFLSRILAESDAREMVPCKIEIITYTPGAVPRIVAKIWGEQKRARDAIKAVTFHELRVEEDIKTGCKIRVLFDV